MSIAKTVEGKLSATLAIISIVYVVAYKVVEQYPQHRPDMNTVLLMVSLIVSAYFFYKIDKTTKPKEYVNAGVSEFLDYLANILAEKFTLITGSQPKKSVQSHEEKPKEISDSETKEEKVLGWDG